MYMYLCDIVCVFPGDLQSAVGHFEVYRKLAHKHRWCTDTGDSVYEIACEHCRRLYTSMAKQVIRSSIYNIHDIQCSYSAYYMYDTCA